MKQLDIGIDMNTLDRVIRDVCYDNVYDVGDPR